MKYRESNQDRSLRKWFNKEFNCAHLRGVSIPIGSVRGLSNINLEMNFPITAIAGKNGAGKSTMLALICCAYHNSTKGYTPPGKKNSYYTFADFFIQHSDEVPSTGISIYYKIAYNNWRTSENNPDKVKVGSQLRIKSKKGKWNDYSKRVERNVAFVGIERIVPHSEKSQSRSYKRYFKSSPPKGWEEKVKNCTGYVLGKNYENFEMKYHSKYKLPITQEAGVVYSGFNMGAGENALFEIFSTIYSYPEGAIFVIDEIELGLHAEAQKRFITRLKDICLERKAQIIFTTHSKEVFDCLPEDARIYMEKIGQKTVISTGISSEYAFSKLSAEKVIEAEILVEDKVAKSIITSILSTSDRSRINVEIVGSATALCVQIAALHRRTTTINTLIVFDGDQRKNEKHHKPNSKKMSETQDKDFETWFDEHVDYLPGNTWPESWILNESKTITPQIAKDLKIQEQELGALIDTALAAGKHKEFFELSQRLSLSEEVILHVFCNNLTSLKPLHFQNIKSRLENLLKQ